MDVPRDLTSYTRVLKLASTPTRQEFLRTATVSGIGILLIGVIGFLVFTLMSVIPGVGI